MPHDPLGLSALLTTTRITAAPGEKPRDSELDLFGLTHPGKIRKDNQDQFLVCTVHQQVVVHGTSLPDPGSLPLRGERLATILLVADGVGGSAAGGAASRLATEAVTRYVSSTMHTFHAAGQASEDDFRDALRKAALEAHETVRGETARAGIRSMATTLTIAFAVWPRLYVVQVGDSRCYFYLNGKLRQVTRDQTVAQNLVDSGALDKRDADRSPLRNVLASSIGGGEATPEVSVLDVSPRGAVVMLCSDGLTKHVGDAEIATAIGRMESSEQLCRTLLEMALQGGGSDNITILAGRVRRTASP